MPAHKSRWFVIAASLIMSIAAYAQEPSPRRLYMLCLIEDPSCPELFVGVLRDAVANPQFGGTRVQCPKLTESVIQTAYSRFMENMRRNGPMFPTAREEMFLALPCPRM
jgi:hypothetical protein